MTTTAINPTDTEWLEVLTGPGIIQVTNHGILYIHIGTVKPEPDITAFHTVIHGVAHIFNYSGTEKVYVKNGKFNRLSIVVTPLL